MQECVLTEKIRNSISFWNINCDLHFTLDSFTIYPIPQSKYLFGRVVPVVLLAPELGVHLQLDILEIGLSVDVLRIGVNVPLGHVVVGVTGPVLVVAEVAQFLPENNVETSFLKVSAK